MGKFERLPKAEGDETSNEIEERDVEFVTNAIAKDILHVSNNQLRDMAHDGYLLTYRFKSPHDEGEYRTGYNYVTSYLHAVTEMREQEHLDTRQAARVLAESEAIKEHVDATIESFEHMIEGHADENGILSVRGAADLLGVAPESLRRSGLAKIHPSYARQIVYAEDLMSDGDYILWNHTALWPEAESETDSKYERSPFALSSSAGAVKKLGFERHIILDMVEEGLLLNFRVKSPVSSSRKGSDIRYVDAYLDAVVTASKLYRKDIEDVLYELVYAPAVDIRAEIEAYIDEFERVAMRYADDQGKLRVADAAKLLNVSPRTINRFGIAHRETDYNHLVVDVRDLMRDGGYILWDHLALRPS